MLQGHLLRQDMARFERSFNPSEPIAGRDTQENHMNPKKIFQGPHPTRTFVSKPLASAKNRGAAQLGLALLLPSAAMSPAFPLP